MNKFYLLLSILLLSQLLHSQLISLSASSSGLTAYTNGAQNDSIYFFCPGALGELNAIAPGGTGPWDFEWQEFNLPTNSWYDYLTESDVFNSSITNLDPGGYRVTIIDGDGVIVGCYRAWIVQVTEGPTVDVAPIPPGCSSVNLVGTIDAGTITPYYNPPADPIIIDSNTEITVCMNANHTFVSDLGFHLVGPIACGSPDILLAPNPGTNCNAGNNINGLCFTTEPSPNYNVCAMGTPLSGTFDSYGPGNTLINWAPLYGCDATQPGWKVQIYDCVGVDIGALTNVTITFTGQTICGDTATVVYASGSINSFIADNSCSAATASSYTVPVSPAQLVPYEFGFEWNAAPDFEIPGYDTYLDILLNPYPFESTMFTLEITLGPDASCGGNSEDSEWYEYLPPVFPNVEPVGETCEFDDPFFLVTDLAGGLWSGIGITDASTGEFDPAVAGPGTHVITYTINNGCLVWDEISIVVVSTIDATIEAVSNLCVEGESIQLTAANPNGTWSGPGITDETSGVFDPAVAGVGTHTVSYEISGTCVGYDEVQITVQPIPSLSISDPGTFCIDDEEYELDANINGGVWSGSGINDSAEGIFDPGDGGAGTQTISYFLDGVCPVTAEIDIIVNDLPNISAGDNAEICEGESVVITVTGGAFYNWTPTTGLSNAFDNNPSASPSSTTTYTVTGTDSNGCVNSDVITVFVYGTPQVSITADQTICEGESVVLNATGIDNWSWSPGNSLSDIDVQNPTASPDATTTYTVTGTDENGCVGTASVTVNVVQIAVSIIADPTEGLQPLYVQFNGESNANDYDWDFGNGESSSDADPSTTYTELGTYTATLTVTLGDCTESVSVSILVYNNSWLFIPNIVTPNNDGENDVFKMQSQFIETFSLTIFDRWGGSIATLDSPADNWNPSDVSGGTYYFVVTAEGYDGVSYNRDGYIQVVK
ncbi:MAG: gliding motility-associated C-terminal domain-containing protein [Flavobacteriales bacterium]|nr:gliding motility-associated C-terminal domain-containing protein [Flavobacteriales bacterium]